MKKLLAFISIAIAVTSISGVANAENPELEAGYVTELNSADVFYSGVPKSQTWPKKSLVESSKAILSAKKILSAQLSRLKLSGAFTASQVESVVEDSLGSVYRPYLSNLNRFHILGLDENAGLVGKTGLLPAANKSRADWLVRLKDPVCRLGDVSVWHPSSWFLSECEVVTPSVTEYLRAAAFEHSRKLARDSYIIKVQAIHMMVIACLYNHMEYRVDRGKFECDYAKKAWNVNFPIWLNERTPLGGYRLKFYSSRNAATLTYLRPDFAKLALGVRFDEISARLVFNSNTEKFTALRK
jgi:hypothetical protein